MPGLITPINSGIESIPTTPPPPPNPPSQNLGFTPANPNAPLSEQNPLPGQNYLPNNFNNLYNAKLGETQDFFSNKLNYGIGAPAIGFNSTSSGQTGTTDPMAQAIQNKAANNYGSAVAATKAGNAQQAAALHSTAETQGVQEMGAEYANDVQNFNQQYQYEVQRQNLLNTYHTGLNSAAAGTVGQILGGIGSVVTLAAAA